MGDATPVGFKTLFMVNQAAGPLNRELLEDLAARGVRATVLAGWVDVRPGVAPPFEIIYGKPLAKAPVWRRLWTWGVFTLQAFRHLVKHRREPVFVTTNPPWVMLGLPCLRRLFGVRYVLLMYDIYPDVAERMGHAKPGGLVGRIWRALSRRAMCRAEGVITLGSHMADTLRGHLHQGDVCPIEVIPNWADTDAIRPLDKADNPFAREHGLVGKLVVTYSGSFGATHDTESIVEVASRLRDLPDVHVMLIGGGTREREVAQLVADRNVANLTLLPFQPADVLPYSLAASDCAIVCLDEGYEGVSVPSKTYSALAAGAALLAVSGPDTELTDLVAERGCGIAIPPRSPDAMEAAIRRLHADRDLLARCREAARRAAVEEFSRPVGTARTIAYLAACFGAAETPSAGPADGR